MRILPTTADSSLSTSLALPNTASNYSGISQKGFLPNFPSQPVFMNPFANEGNQSFGQPGDAKYVDERCIYQNYKHSTILNDNRKPQIYKGTIFLCN